MKKEKYSFFSNVKYSFKTVKKVDSRLLWYNIISIIMDLLIPLLNMSVAPCIVYILSKDFYEINYLIGIIAGLIIIETLFYLFDSTVKAHKYVSEHKIVLFYHEQLYTKILKVDYDMIENPNTRVIYDKAEEAVKTNHAPFVHMSEYFCQIITHILKFVIFCFIIVFLNPLILLGLATTALFEYLTMLYIDKYEYKTRDERQRIKRKMTYFAKLSENYKTAKDIRLYGLNTWLKRCVSELINDHYRVFNKYTIRKIVSSFIDLIIIVLRDGFAYIYLILKIKSGEISPAEFLIYFSVISQFVDILGEIVMSFESLTQSNYSAKDYRTFLNHENKERGNEIFDGRSVDSIKFSNVCFRYPGADNDTINNLDLEISAGEKIAIVGLNGAGKTTLIKLLCGMYSPTEGAIYLNGKEQSLYDRDEYYKFFSTVFQKISVMPFTIRENIVYSEYDKSKLEHSLKMSGLDEKVKALSDGVDTYLVPNVFSKAIDLSGGEMQKLAFSRSVYKNAPILVLDEPTAALDPLSEELLYKRYCESSENKISFFISHRLASTRFCDRILYLENGRIVETGTHDELLLKNGKYAELFNVQAKYYK